MKKQIICTTLIISMLLALFAPTASALQTPAIFAADVTATAGGYAYVYLKANNLVDLQALDFQLHYDSTKMSVHYTSKSTLLSGTTTDINTSTDGVVSVSTISASGINCSYETDIMTVCFKINSNCPVGEYKIAITVGDAYDGSFAPISISAQDINLKVNAAAQQSFPFYFSYSGLSYKKGETFTFSVYHNSTNVFSSADFHITYDKDLFRLKNIALDSNLSGGLTSINTAIEGMAIISYASTNAVSSGNLFTAELEVIANVNESSVITVESSDVYNDDLVSYAPYTNSFTVQLEKLPELPDYKNVWLNSEPLNVGEISNATLMLEAGVNIAAADFEITYDTNIFECTEVAAADQALQAGSFVVINPNYTTGKIKFSYVNENGYGDTDLALVNIKLIPRCSPQTHYTTTIDAAGVIDKDFSDISLEFVSESGCIFALSHTPPTCTEMGYDTYTCGCSQSYTDNYVDANGHNYSSGTDYKSDFYNHWYYCTVCGDAQTGSEQNHSYINSTDICDDCGNERTITGIKISKLPTKTEYFEGDSLDTTGIEVAVICDNGLTQPATDFDTSYDLSTVGEKNVTVSYGGKTTNFNVNVVHELDTVPEKANSCTEAGYSEHLTCKRCDYIEGKTDYTAIGHNTVKIDGKAASKNADGWKDYYVCETCDAYFEDKAATIDIADLDEWKVGDGKLTYIEAKNTVTGDMYASLSDALTSAQSGETVALVIDVTTDYVMVSEGVTLDINGKSLTLKYITGFGDSNIIDSNVTENSGIYVPKKHLVVSETNAQLPVYDAKNGCYMFTDVNLDYTYYENSSYYFGPETVALDSVEGARANLLLRENSADTGVEIIVHLDWETKDYFSTQDFTYKSNYVEQYFQMAYEDGHYNNVYFYARFSSAVLKQAESVTVTTIVQSDCGFKALSESTSFKM